MSQKYRPAFSDSLGSLIGGPGTASGYELFGFSHGAPTASQAGWNKGAFVIDVDNGALYYNSGTVLAATWTSVGTGGSPTFTTVVTDAINGSAAAFVLTIKANTAAAFTITDGTTSLYVIDSRNTVTGVVTHLFASPAAMTVAGASGTVHSAAKIAAYTITDSTATLITALDGLGLYIDVPTVAQSGGAVTVTTMSTLYVTKPVAGTSVTGTNKYIINTDQTGCFCTAAGVWTDTASTQRIKKAIADVLPESITSILDRLRPRTWKYDPDQVGDDQDRQRYGIVSEELPECFRIPGITNDHGGLNGSILGSFALAALKVLRDENRDLRGRLERLEAAHG